ncbi:Hypothetical predicted protein [Pelobates cultripes]|uniref:Uncharacterized protein n=1 Tax=Pelobates cultripes TaxID=61616 RepID=A0AAD1RAU1_PELCU|nr:Hypothetical predicted protein [Pelobates cultripes]
MATSSAGGETPERHTDMPDYEAKLTAIFEALWARLEHRAWLNKPSTCWSNKKPKQHSRQRLTHKQHRAPRWRRSRRDPLPAGKIRGRNQALEHSHRVLGTPNAPSSYPHSSSGHGAYQRVTPHRNPYTQGNNRNPEKPWAHDPEDGVNGLVARAPANALGRRHRTLKRHGTGRCTGGTTTQRAKHPAGQSIHPRGTGPTTNRETGQRGSPPLPRTTKWTGPRILQHDSSMWGGLNKCMNAYSTPCPGLLQVNERDTLSYPKGFTYNCFLSHAL